MKLPGLPAAGVSLALARGICSSLKCFGNPASEFCYGIIYLLGMVASDDEVPVVKRDWLITLLQDQTLLVHTCGQPGDECCAKIVNFVVSGD